LPPIDPAFLLEVENDARHLATSLDNLVESLAGTMHVSANDGHEVMEEILCREFLP